MTNLILTLCHKGLNSFGLHYADNVFKCIGMNENDHIWIWISLKFIPKYWIDDKSLLVQGTAWQQIDTEPSAETMLTKFILTNLDTGLLIWYILSQTWAAWWDHFLEDRAQ